MATAALRDQRVRHLAARLEAMVDDGHPLAGFVLSYFKAMLDEWEDPNVIGPPTPFGDSPLLSLIESMLPSVDAQDPDSGALIRTLMRQVRASRDAAERRHLSRSLEWFYLYFTRKTELDFDAWIAERGK